VAEGTQLPSSSKSFQRKGLSTETPANWPDERTRFGHGVTDHRPGNCETGVAISRRERAQASRPARRFTGPVDLDHCAAGNLVSHPKPSTHRDISRLLKFNLVRGSDSCRTTYRGVARRGRFCAPPPFGGHYRSWSRECAPAPSPENQATAANHDCPCDDHPARACRSVDEPGKLWFIMPCVH
jgi:hypothetical protein